MKQDRHDEYVKAVKALEEKLKAKTVDSFDLTEEEQKALETVPDSVFQSAEEVLSRLQPMFPEFDFGEAAVVKFVAMIYAEKSTLLEAFREGYDAGSET